MIGGLEALFEDEEQRHADQRQVMGPTAPAAHFGLRHAQFALGILERTLNPKPLRLHVAKPLPTGFWGAVAQAILPRSVFLLTDDQESRARRRRGSIPLPKGLDPELRAQGPARGLTHRQRSDSRRQNTLRSIA